MHSPLRCRSTSVFVGATLTAVSAGLWAVPLAAQTAAAGPAPVTPSECQATLAETQKSTIQAAQAAGKPVDGAALRAQLSARAKGCLANIDTTKLDRTSMIQLGTIDMIAGDSVSAIGLFDRAADDASGAPAERADALLAIIRATATTPHADEYVAKLDALPNMTLPRYLARRLLLGYYLNYDIDDKLEDAAHAMITLAHDLPVAQQQEQAASTLEAYRSLAALYANRLHPDSALALLHAAPAQQPNIPDAAQKLAEDVARYEMVGKAAPTVNADYWINGQAKPYTSGVTVVLFTANWCHSCRDSYPTVEKLNADLKAKGLQTVLAVSLDGVFEGVQMTSPEQEVAANKQYFVDKHKFTYPIAIQKPSAAEQPASTSATMTGNDAQFHLRGLPQFIVVDQKGIVRAVLIGWDPYGNRGRALTAVVQHLLNV